MIPKGRASTGGRDRNNKNRVSPGSIVEYEQHGNPLLGVVTKPLKKKWLVLNEDSKEIPLASERLYLLPGRLPANDWPNEKKVNFLRQLSQKAGQKTSSLKMEDIWKQCQNASGSRSVSELTKSVFKSDQILQHLALRRAFLNDQIYFTRKGQGFEPRKETDVERKQEEAKLKAEQAASKQKLIDAICLRLKDQSTELPQSIDCLEDLAVWGSKNPSAREGKEVLNACKKEASLELDGKPADQALNLLVKLGHFSPGDNLSVVRYRVERGFTEEVIEAAKQVLEQELSSERHDFTNLLTISIDGSGTKDIDDALSIVQKDGQTKVAIHISDVSSRIEANSPLDDLALLRASSIYTPDESINMLPTLLSEEGLSLMQGQVRPALSFLTTLSETGAIEQLEILPSIIKVDHNLSYNFASAVLCGENTDCPEEFSKLLQSLWDFAAMREVFRIDCGATHLDRRDMAPKLDQNGQVSLVAAADDSPAFKLVGEMMILANECAATYASQNNFPLIFRSQERPSEDIHEAAKDMEEGPAREYFLRSLLKRSEIVTQARPHFGLGVEKYAQATSPIRRAVDLVNQQQLTSHITKGEALWSHEQLKSKLKKMETGLEKTALVQSERNRYWLLKYFEEANITEFDATIVKLSGPKPLAELDISRTTASFKSSRKKFALGERVKLEIEQMQPQRGMFRLLEKISENPL